MEESSNLYNFRSYFTKEKCDNLSKLAKDTIGSSGTLWAPEGAKLGDPQAQVTLRFIGELFGNKIQREIKYGENINFKVFYVELDNKPLVWSDEEEKNMMTVTNLSNIFNFTTVPVIAVGCLEEMYSMEIGLSQIAIDSICEGYCYRVVDGVQGIEEDNSFLSIILKKRSDNYLETTKEFSEEDDVVQQIRSCITRQRILNILSKGFRGKMNVTKLTFLMWKDIFNEFDISKNFRKKIQKLYDNDASNVITQVLRERTDDEINIK